MESVTERSRLVRFANVSTAVALGFITAATFTSAFPVVTGVNIGIIILSSGLAIYTHSKSDEKFTDLVQEEDQATDAAPATAPLRILPKRDLARAWIKNYSASGSAVLVASVIPGLSSVALSAMAAKMSHEIGKIYLGADYPASKALSVSGTVGLHVIVGRLVALESLNLVPFAGWAIKAVMAVGILQSLGEAFIGYYEKSSVNENGPS